MSILSTLIGAITGVVGIYLSYYIDIASGASIVLLQAFFFCVALAVNSMQKSAARRLAHTHI
jgi:manganese/iron transport system permease protein/iron/zinc/copper transport system permease protein